MKLPQINPSRLQRVVADLEFNKDYASFDELCHAIGQTDWAQRFELDSQTVARLVVHHGTITKVEKPAKIEDPEAPKVEKPAKIEDPEAPSVKTYDEGGRGKKQCPSCLKYVGGRNARCACGHEFSREAPVEPVRPKAPEPKPVREVTVASPAVRGHGGYRRTTYIPSGACPHRLTGTDAATVAEWAERVRDTYGQQQEAFLTLAGLKYWARDFYDIFSREYDEVTSQLELLDTPL